MICCRHAKIFIFNALDDIGDFRNCLRNFTGIIVIRNKWRFRLCTCVEQVHTTHAQTVTFFSNIGIDIELPFVAPQELTAIFGRWIWLFLGFEVEDLNRITLITNEIDIAF